MSFPSLQGDELIEWVEHTSAGFQKLVEAHPEILEAACDIRETKNVGELLQHIVAVELRYVQRLHAMPEAPYESIPFDSPEVIFATHELAMTMLRQLQGNPPAWWAEPQTFSTRRGGPIQTTRSDVFVHLLMHSIRHYAQLATLFRQEGLTPDWPMDFIFLRAKS